MTVNINDKTFKMHKCESVFLPNKLRLSGLVYSYFLDRMIYFRNEIKIIRVTQPVIGQIIDVMQPMINARKLHKLS